MCGPILVTLLKMQPLYSQSSRKNATPPSGTSPLAYYQECPTPGKPNEKMLRELIKIHLFLLPGSIINCMSLLYVSIIILEKYNVCSLNAWASRENPIVRSSVTTINYIAWNFRFSDTDLICLSWGVIHIVSILLWLLYACVKVW